MRTILLFTILCLACCTTQAQVSNYFSEPIFGVQQGAKMVQDESGNIYAFGKYTDTLRIGDLSVISAGYFDVYVAKFNSAFEPQWLQSFGGINDDGAGDIAYHNGRLYCTGWYAGAMAIGDVTFEFEATYNQYPGYVFVVDTEGAVVNARSFRTFNSVVAYGSGIDADDSGLVIAGAMKGEMNFGNNVSIMSSMLGTETDLFVAKLDLDLVAQWAIRNNAVSGSNNCFDGLTDVAMDEAHNIYFTGYFGSNPTLNPGYLYWADQILVSDGGYGFSDALYGKLIPTGQLAWAYVTGGALPDAAQRLTLLNDTTLVLAGWYSDYSDLSGEALPPSIDSYSKFVGAVHTDGTPIDAVRLNAGTEMYSLRAGADGIVYGADLTNSANALHLFGYDASNGIVFEDSLAINNFNYNEMDLLPPSAACSALYVSTSFKDTFGYNDEVLINHTGTNAYVDLLFFKYNLSNEGLLAPTIAAEEGVCATDSLNLIAASDAIGAVYHWSLSPESAGSLLTDGSNALFVPSDEAAQATIACYVSNACDISPSATPVEVAIWPTPGPIVWQTDLEIPTVEIVGAETLLWYYNGEALPESTNSNLLPCQEAEGAFTIVGISAEGCEISDTQVLDCTDNILELAFEPAVYPNPAHDQLMVPGQWNRVRCYDLAGQEVTMNQRVGQQWSVAHLPTGYYILELQNHSRIYRLSFAVAHP